MEKITADEAARLIEDGDAILISGSGGGHAVPEALLAAVERRFLAEGKPTRPHVGQRRRRRRPRGARRRAISRTKACCSARSPARWSTRPASCGSPPRTRSRRTRLPQGVLSQLMRDMAAGPAGPPHQDRPRHVRRSAPAGRAAEPAHAAGLRRGGRARRRGMAVLQAGAGDRRVPARHDGRRGRQRHDGGGGRARRDARDGAGDAPRRRHRRSCRSSAWRGAARCRRSRCSIPGILVDFVVVDAEQRQTYATYYDPSYSGELRIPVGDIKSLPFGPRKVIVRRAAMELFPGAICNLGAGVSTGLSTIAAEEGLLDARVPHQRAGHHRRRADHRPRFGRRPELRRDDRAAGAVRFLRRRRARPRVPVVRGGRCARATSTSAASATRSSASAASSTSARTRAA